MFKDKTFAVIATAGADYNGGLSSLEKYMEEFTSEFSTKLYQLTIPCCSSDSNELRANNEIREKAKEFGDKLAEVNPQLQNTGRVLLSNPTMKTEFLCLK